MAELKHSFLFCSYDLRKRFATSKRYCLLVNSIYRMTTYFLLLFIGVR